MKTLVALVSLFTCVAHAEPVRVAVVGVTGEAPPAELQRLASQLRTELASRSDPALLTVVTRDEMKRVYESTGNPCRPDDIACVVEASAGWSGRLFVSGTATATVDGIMLFVRMSSVRGAQVAQTRALASRIDDIASEIVAQEQQFRARMIAAAPPQVAVAVEEADICHCFVVGPLPRPGDLVFDEHGIKFTSTGGFGKEWRYRWSDIVKADTTFTSAYRPGIYLTPTSEMDFIVVYFENDGQRDRCFNTMNRRRGQRTSIQ